MAVRWRLVLEYDGADFAGWAVQPGQRTIQGELQAALAQLLGHPVTVAVSGRTDAGVHAERQVAAFDTTSVRERKNILRGLSSLLPDDVAAVDAGVVPASFDPRRDAKRKHYRYVWLDRRERSPLRRRRVWWVRRPLDVEAMDRAAAHILGTHDFSSFRATKCDATHPRRTIPCLDVTRVGDEVHLNAYGHGFLRHMVRIIAGTLTDVGRGRRDPAWLAEVLAARDRAAAGRTAPACGLTLVSVSYLQPPEPSG